MPDVTLDSLQSGGSYPQWATEESLQKLLMLTKDTPSYHRFMQKFAAKMSRGGGDIADVMKTAADEMKEWSREVVKASKDKDKSGLFSSKLAADGAASLGSAADSAASRLGAMAKSATRTDTSMSGAFGNITDMLKMMVSLIAKGGEVGAAAVGKVKGLRGNIDAAGGGGGTWSKILGGLSKFAEGAVAAMATGLGVAMSLIDDFGQSLRKTGDLGVSFGESFMQLRVQLADAGLGLDNLEKQLALNSTAFALMGDNVQAGIKVWVDWRKRFVKEGDMEFFTNLGFAMEELNDYFLKDTRNRILAGRDRESATDEATESLRELARNTKAVSELTGESRKKLMAAVIERESDAKWQAYLRQLPVEEAENLRTSMKQMSILYGFSEKQMKAMQDAVRLGGDVSLLAPQFGGAFDDFKFMPQVLQQLMDTIKMTATGQYISPQAQRERALGYHELVNAFGASPQGRMLSQIGGTLIDFNEGFVALQQAVLFLQNPAAFIAGGGNINEPQAGSPTNAIVDSIDEIGNMTILGGQQIGAIMQNIFAKGVTDQMRGLIEEELGTLVRSRQAYMQGDLSKEEYDKVVTSFEKLFEGGGQLAGWVSATMGSMAVSAATMVIEGSVEVIKFAKSLNADVARDFLSNIFGLSGDHPSERNQPDQSTTDDDGLSFNVNDIEASRKKLMAAVIEPGSQYEFAEVDHNAHMRALTGETMAEDFGQMLHVWTSASRSLDEKMEQQVANNTATANEVSRLVQAGHGVNPDNKEFQNRYLATLSSIDKKLGSDGPISDAVRNSKAYT